MSGIPKLAWARGIGLALLLVATTETGSGQGIIYGTPSQPIGYNPVNNVSFDIDVNGDGTVDYTVISQFGQVLLQPHWDNRIITIPASPPDLGYLVAALPTGFSIGSSLDPVYAWYDRNTDAFGTAVIGVQMDVGAISYFLGQTAFVGLDLVYGGEDHYGWMRIDNPLQIVAGQIVDWAYQTRPNTPILAGAVPEPSAEALIILAGGLILLGRKRDHWRKI